MAAASAHSGLQAESFFRELLAWCRGHVDRIDWGSGAQDGSMIAVVHGAGRDQVPFTAWTYGRVEIDFQYLRTHSPFKDESLRRELMNRLNEILGVQLPLDRLNSRPAIPCQVLVPESARLEFFAVFEWAVELIRGAE